MRVLLWSFLSAVLGLLACTMTGCGRKAPPVAQNTPLPPRVAEPLTPMPVPPLPEDDTVADFDPKKDVLEDDVRIDLPREPKTPEPPKFEPRKNDPLRGIAPKPEQPRAEVPKVAPPERRFENVQQVLPPAKPVARRPVTERDMKDIHLFVDTASGASGVMPDPTTIQAALGASGSPAAKLVATEDIVLTGSRQRESCWAYQKGAATDGGWIVTNSGPEQVDAATAKRWIGGR